MIFHAEKEFIKQQSKFNLETYRINIYNNKSNDYGLEAVLLWTPNEF